MFKKILIPVDGSDLSLRAAATGVQLAKEVGAQVVFLHGITAIAYFYLAWYAYQNALIAHDELSTILQVPGSLGYGCLTAGLFLVGLCSLGAIVRHTLGHEPVHVNLADAGPGVV